MEETQERLLNHEAVKIEIGQPALPFAELDPEVKLAVECAADRKAFDMRVLDLRDVASFTEFFIICSGANQRQVQAIADQIEEQLKNKTPENSKENGRTASPNLLKRQRRSIH